MIIWQEKKLQEKLERATKHQFKLLQKQIDSDPEMQRMLTSPMGNVSQYEWLASGYERDHSLLNGLKFIAFFEKKAELFFIKTGNTFTGFLAYMDDGQEIRGIKIASFYEKKSNVTMVVDLINFIEKQISQRKSIGWQANVMNKWANDQYEALLNKRKFIWKREEDKYGQNYIYTVTGQQT
jgi:predicted transcriptional regulator